MKEDHSKMRHVRTGEPPTTPTAALMSSRWPITAVFFLNGLLLATYLVRLPTLKQTHQFNDGQMGAVGMLFALAALASMQFVGQLTAKYGTAPLIRVGLLVMPAALVGTGLAKPTIAYLAFVAVLGCVHGVLDVSMNAHAVAMERVLGRPILSGCHAAWSISAVTASAVGAILIAGQTTAAAEFLGAGLIVAAVGVGVGSLLLVNRPTASTAPAPDGRPAAPVRPRASGPNQGWTSTVVKLGLIGVVLMVCEGAALAWGGIYLRDDRGASLALSSMAVVAFTGCQTLVRIFGDGIRAKVGDAPVFRLGAVVGAAGLTLALLSRDPGVAVAGFAILGIGTAVLLPLTFGAVGRSAAIDDQAAALSRFTTFTYAGILLGPALIGWVAELIGLPWTLAALIPLLGILSLAGHLLAPDTQPHRIGSTRWWPFEPDPIR